MSTLLVDRDYGRDQSQLMRLRDGGLDRLFAIDWLAATDEAGDWSIEGYVAVLEEAVQFLGGRVNLVGDCQSGRLAVSTRPTPRAREHAHHRNGLDCLPHATNSRSTGHLFVSVVVCSAGSTNLPGSSFGTGRWTRAPDGPSRQHPRSRLRDSAHRLHQLVRMDTDLPGAF